jgi:RimJ/RimL family protein N-acetyltransferase
LQHIGATSSHDRHGDEPAGAVFAYTRLPMDDPRFALGAPVPDASPAPSPPRTELVGRHVALTPLDPEQDGPALHAASHGSADKQAIWTYLPYGPFDSPAVMTAWLRDGARQQDPLFWTVRALAEDGLPVGMTSFLSIVPAMRRLEIGHIWYSPSVQRTKLTTEATFLLLRQAFALGYRRVEWKCNALNVRSRAAAERFGFRPEGTFRQHMIIRGRNRDTAWYAMLDADWPAVKANFERWLYADGPQPSLRELNAQLPSAGTG